MMYAIAVSFLRGGEQALWDVLWMLPVNRSKDLTVHVSEDSRTEAARYEERSIGALLAQLAKCGINVFAHTQCELHEHRAIFFFNLRLWKLNHCRGPCAETL